MWWLFKGSVCDIMINSDTLYYDILVSAQDVL